MTIKFGSLFSGIGGIDLGFERAGLQCTWQVEIDPYATKILERHWPHVPRYPDVRTLQPSTLEAVDCICGGFPCQPVSVAGKRQAQSDSRWLWPEFARVVDAVRPRYVLVENVPGLLTTAGSEVIVDLAEMGYHAEWGYISAAAFGAPYRRNRVFILAYNDSTKLWPEQINEFWRLSTAVNRNHSENVSDVTRIRRVKRGSESTREQGRPCFTGCGWWAVEPGVGRVVSGIPHRVDRIRGLGNAVVPQVAEYLGHVIKHHATTQSPPT